ncbi:MAG TPA: SGNH/GDSL hydrolase family protein [Streptosporangiaceae bacterium]|nr:SGNH/GDSL hydrolase family protein [Streptosporangiaceae bacterium]
MADSGAGRSRRRGLLGRRSIALAIGFVVLLVVAGGPLGGLRALRCVVVSGGCETTATPRLEPPRLRPLSALDIATQGGYVALGDSYSAGEGAYEIPADLAPGNRCHRTSRAYFHAIADTFPFRRGSAFWACSGATTGDILRGGHGQPPQLSRVTADTSLVTLSIGGNDIGFARVLAGCVVRFPWSEGCQAQGAQIDAKMRALRAALRDVLGKIVVAAPLARVIVVGYPRIFSETSGQDFDNIGIGDQRWLNLRARALDDLIREVALAADRQIVAAYGAGSVEYVDAFDAFAGHEIGAKDPFVNGLDVDLSALSAEARSFHPNAGGYRRLAQLVTRQITNGPGRTILQYR